MEVLVRMFCVVLQFMPDHALYSAGGRVVGHSHLHASQTTSNAAVRLAQYVGLRSNVHPHANKVRACCGCASLTTSATLR
eukprot:4662128-Pyramimonas_sp.AAC.2